MGRFKLEPERLAKRLKAIDERKRLQIESEATEKLKRPEKITRHPEPDIVNFGQDNLRQKKG